MLKWFLNRFESIEDEIFEGSESVAEGVCIKSQGMSDSEGLREDDW
jgi:hypothetical protein